MKIKLKDIPLLPEDHFHYGNSYKATGVYFWCRIIDEIIDTGFDNEWKPVGKSYSKKLLSENRDIILLFENDCGEQSWFHLSLWKSDDL